MVERLQVKACSIGKILSSLERKYNNTHEKDDKGMTKSPSGQKFGSNPPSKRNSVRIQRIPPFDANKIRKSPSTEKAAIAQESANEAWDEALASEKPEDLSETITPPPTEPIEQPTEALEPTEAKE